MSRYSFCQPFLWPPRRQNHNTSICAQGANDPSVNKAESDQIVEALQKRGIDVEYMLKENEGHGFQNEENRIEFYHAMVEFVDKHLK